LTPSDLIDAAVKVVGPKATKPEPETREALLAFFKDRVAYQLEIYSRSHTTNVLAEHVAWFISNYPQALNECFKAKVFPWLSEEYFQRVIEQKVDDSDVNLWVEFVSDKYFQQFHEISLALDSASPTEPEVKRSRVRAVRNRLRNLLRNVGRVTFRAGWEDIQDLRSRFNAMSLGSEDPRFDGVGQSAKRISNILKDETPVDAFDATVLQDATEKTLAERLKAIEATRDHKDLLAALADLAEPLEAFFNAVMVKCDDPALRAARLSLLHRLRQAFLRVADFSLWQ
jgi:glycyl-tRNA synthetase beta subunit